jgi:fucose permease
LIVGALLLSGVGFFLYWGFSAPALAIAGLFVSGLGVANLYPLTLSQALAVAPENSNLAGARAAFASGTAILLLPLLLGGLADQVGIRLAYGVVALLLVLALGFFWLAKSQSNQGLF